MRVRVVCWRLPARATEHSITTYILQRDSACSLNPRALRLPPRSAAPSLLLSILPEGTAAPEPQEYFVYRRRHSHDPLLTLACLASPAQSGSSPNVQLSASAVCRKFRQPCATDSVNRFAMAFVSRER
eukprot:6195519-Pleurochrysis_carterae.AAC.2